MNARELPTDPLPLLPPRAPDSHKGAFGRALLIGGSRGMSGAIALAGRAALRGGAGLVQLAVPAQCQPAVAAAEPSYLTLDLADDDAGRISVRAAARLLEFAEKATAVACGPGLARSRGLDHLVATLYARVPRPMVLDADALNALAEHVEILRQPPAPRLLTPHPGEFARLTGLTTGEVQSRREELARQFASRHDVILVLKGHGTVITDGRRTALNATGNPGMASGGTGDVLTGLLTALLCQGLEPFDAARLGCHVHGLAGDLAAARLGQVSLIASDLVEYLGLAFQSLEGQRNADEARSSACLPG